MSTSRLPYDARRFLQWLDSEAKTFVFVALAEAPGCSEKPHEWRATPEAAADELLRRNRIGCGIFVAIHDHDGRRSSKTATRARAAFVDLDGSPLDPVVNAKLAPEVIVQTSPGKFHCYWKPAGLTLENLARTQKALATRYGGDPSVSDAARIMRLPGFRHRKGEPFESRIVAAPRAPKWVSDEIRAAVMAVDRAPDDDRLRALNRSSFWLGQLSHVPDFDSAIACRELELIGLDRGLDPAEVTAEIDAAFEAGKLLPARGAA